MQVTHIKDAKYGTLKVPGWIHNISKYKDCSHCILCDRVGENSSILMVVPNSIAANLTDESYVEIYAIVNINPNRVGILYNLKGKIKLFWVLLT